MSSSPNLQHIAQTRFTQIQMLLRMQIKKSAFWKCWRNDRGNIRTAMPLWIPTFLIIFLSFNLITYLNKLLLTKSITINMKLQKPLLLLAASTSISAKYIKNTHIRDISSLNEFESFVLSTNHPTVVQFVENSCKYTDIIMPSFIGEIQRVAGLE